MRLSFYEKNQAMIEAAFTLQVLSSGPTTLHRSLWGTAKPMSRKCLALIFVSMSWLGCSGRAFPATTPELGRARTLRIRALRRSLNLCKRPQLGLTLSRRARNVRSCAQHNSCHEICFVAPHQKPARKHRCLQRKHPRSNCSNDITTNGTRDCIELLLECKWASCGNDVQRNTVRATPQTQTLTDGSPP